jgi:hypothetical protein
MKYILTLALTLLPFVSSAQIADNGRGGELQDFMFTILRFIEGYIIPFILSIGFLLFVWGMFNYFIRGGANDEAKESGKSLIMYAIAGFVVILGFWGLVNILSNGLGLEDERINKRYLPSVIPESGNNN